MITLYLDMVHISNGTVEPMLPILYQHQKLLPSVFRDMRSNKDQPEISVNTRRVLELEVDDGDEYRVDFILLVYFHHKTSDDDADLISLISHAIPIERTLPNI
jgi:hypothetical protein